tara:strand:+ start:2551 stop:3546 length:996 start_codon:yes stop_codon:yes gene_type:complete
MNILFYCPLKFNLKSKNNSNLGGIETLNLELSKFLSSNKDKIYLSTICKKIIKKNNLINLPISTIKTKNNKYNFDYVISSNDPSIFNYYKNSKNILWMHNTLAIEKAIRKKKFFPILSNKINAVFVSEYLNKNTSKLYNFKSRTVISNFLSSEFDKIKLNYNRKPNVIWSVSRNRGLDKLIDIWINDIFKINSKAKLHIFGINKHINKRKLKNYNIFFHGRVNKIILKKYYKKSACSICLGYDETFCLNAIESMSCGTPVLSFKKTALNSLINNGENGYKTENFRDLSLKIKKILNLRLDKRKKLIKRTLLFSKKYKKENIVKKWKKFINI